MVILADRDYVGEIHAAEIEWELRRMARTLRRLTLPVQHKGDVSDFLDAGGTLQDLLELAAAAKQKVHDWELHRAKTGQAIKYAFEIRASPTEKLVLIALGCLSCPTQANVALAVNLSLPRAKAVIRDLKAKRLVQASKDGRTVVYSPSSADDVQPASAG